ADRARGRGDARAARETGAGRDDHAPPADRQSRRSPLPRREGSGRSDAYPDRETVGSAAQRRDRAYARRPRVPLDALRMSTLIEFTGPARLDRRTKRLVHRLGEGDVAVVDHPDLDRVSAEELLETGVRVVVNVAPSLSGRFPNPGPLLLVRGGVTLIDAPGAPLFDEVSEGEPVTVRGASVFRNGTCLARGRALGERELEQALTEQRSRVTESLSQFAENTLQHLKAEGSLLAEGLDLPPLETRFRDRHALVVARGPGHKRDLRIVRPYIRDFKPVLVGVDGGAHALNEAGYTPDVIVGDMDSVPDRALRSGAEVVVHGY